MTWMPGVVGVVIPAHNEERLIDGCLRAVADAAASLPDSVVVHVIVVCDACDDRTADIVEQHGFLALACEARNVGIARATGADAALVLGAEWLAFTDADTVVSSRWIVAQLALSADVVCGTIGIDDWTEYETDHGDALRVHFENTYSDIDGHRHIHGANLGMSARAYRDVGGFAGLENSEDVAIVAALEANGATIAWSALPRVVTSARRDFRATAGFGATLMSVASTLVARATLSVVQVASPACDPS